MRSVLVLGGYGVFGGRIAERLAREPAIEVIIAGRSAERAAEFSSRLAKDAQARIRHSRLDGMEVEARDLMTLGARVVVNASGPYQHQDYRLARACIAAGAHYIDLADAREFVTGIGTLDEEARTADVLVVSGASTVPALAAAVIDEHVPLFGALETATIVIAPGNSFDPGLATTQSILGSLGRPIRAPLDPSTAVQTYGWQSLHRLKIPGLGGRWLGACDTPDIDLLPQRYKGLRSTRVFAALEVGAFHLGLWGTSWLVRSGLLRNPERLAAPLLRVKHALRFLGSDVGGMAVILEGKSRDSAPRRVDWHLIAKRGHGPYVPGIASVILSKGLLAGRLQQRGAMPCLGLFTLAEFLSEVDDLAITAGTT